MPGHRIENRLRFAQRWMQPEYNLRVARLRCGDQRGQVAFQMGPLRHEGRNDVDMSGPAVDQVISGMRKVRLHEFEIGDFNPHTGHALLCRCAQALERQCPVGVACAMRKEEDGLSHKRAFRDIVASHQNDVVLLLIVYRLYRE